MAVEKIILDIQAQVGKAKKDINSLKTTTKGLNKEVNTTANLMKKAGSAMLAFASIGMITKALRDIIALNMEFEKTLTNVMTLLDKTTKAKFGDFLSAGALQTMSKFGLQVNDVNKALFDTISAGIKAGDSIRFLQEAAKLAVGGVTTLSIAVDGMTSIMNAYALSIEDANKVASAFFAAQKAGKTTVAELAQNVGMLAPTAKMAGIGFQEMLAAMALLTKQGIQTDMATTALRATIVALTKTTPATEKIFASLGIQTGITAIKAQGFGETLMQVAKAAEENEDILTQVIPSVRALTAVAALGTDALWEFDKLTQQITKDFGEAGSLAEATAAQMATLAKQGDVGTAMWKRFQIELSNNVKESTKFKTSMFAILAVLELIKGKEEEAPPPADGGYLGKIFFGGQEGLKVFEKETFIKKEDWAKAIDAYKKMMAELEVAIAPTIEEKPLIEKYLGEPEDIQSAKDMYRDLLGEMGSDIISNEEETQQKIADIKKKYRDQEDREDQARADAAIQIEMYKQYGKLDIVKGAFGLAQGLAGESFVVQKVLAIAESLVSTFLSSQLAYASQVGIPIVGPILAAAAKKSAITQGLANTALIAGVALAGFKEGGFTGSSDVHLRDKDGPITGWTHKNEFVFNEEKTRTLRPLFEDIHNNRIDIHGLAALTRRGTMRHTTKLNADILENEVKKIYRKMSEEQTERPVIIHHNNGYTKTIGNTTINVST